jgi:hypothetical protein
MMEDRVLAAKKNWQTAENMHIREMRKLNRKQTPYSKNLLGFPAFWRRNEREAKKKEDKLAHEIAQECGVRRNDKFWAKFLDTNTDNTSIDGTAGGPQLSSANRQPECTARQGGPRSTGSSGLNLIGGTERKIENVALPSSGQKEKN